MAQPGGSDTPDYVAKDAVGEATRTTAITAGAGFAASAIKNALTRQNIGTMAVFTRNGAIIGLFAAMGATFGFSRCACANLREKDDPWNVTIAGFLAGSIAGLRTRSLPLTLGLGAGLAVIQGSFDYAGGKFTGYVREKDFDETEYKEEMQKRRRRPIQEVIDELGEGRGIYGPGYRERRADRIKETYGIDVPRT